MTQMPALTPTGGTLAPRSGDDRQYLTISIAGQTFGVAVELVRDVLGPQRITRIPLALPEVAGSLNLRGRIVTAIDVRLRMGLAKRDADARPMSVVVEHQSEAYSLLVDSVGEVLTLPATGFEKNPANLDPRWREMSLGIHRLDGQLLLVLDVGRLLDFTGAVAA
jgi:purine-binding chemotaxis protein CheW